MNWLSGHEGDGFVGAEFGFRTFLLGGGSTDPEVGQLPRWPRLRRGVA